MNVDDLAELMGKSRNEVEHMLKQNDMIELKLTEKKPAKGKKESMEISEV